jgi:hypothetical protein
LLGVDVRFKRLVGGLVDTHGVLGFEALKFDVVVFDDFKLICGVN